MMSLTWNRTRSPSPPKKKSPNEVQVPPKTGATKKIITNIQSKNLELKVNTSLTHDIMDAARHAFSSCSGSSSSGSSGSSSSSSSTFALDWRC